MDRKDKTIKFDIGNVNVEDNEDSDFMILDIDIASTVPNSHHLVFSKDCLERCGKTFFLKPIIGEYSPFRRILAVTKFTKIPMEDFLIKTLFVLWMLARMLI